MVWATANAAWEATLATLSGHPLLRSVSHCWSLGVVQQVVTGCGKVHVGMGHSVPESPSTHLGVVGHGR